MATVVLGTSCASATPAVSKRINGAPQRIGVNIARQAYSAWRPNGEAPRIQRVWQPLKLPFPCRLEQAVAPARFRALMREADLAIASAGNTLYELCALGVPALVVAHHPRHQAVAEAFARHGAVRCCGIGTEVPVERIAEDARTLLSDAQARRDLSRQGQALVDGLGCGRVAAALLAAVEVA